MFTTDSQLSLCIEKKGNRGYELKKHSAVVQIANKISLVQRKAYNTLLATAREQAINNPTREVFTIPLSQLRAFSGIAINDYKHIGKSLEFLMRTIVNYNILRKDTYQEWGAFVLLSEIKIANGLIHYSLPPTIKSALLQPRLYAKINLAIMRGLSSKYALALYELAKDYINVSIPKMDIDVFRLVMGIEEGQYASIRDLRKRVIEPAIKEINEKTDILISYQFLTIGRKVVGIHLIASETPDTNTKTEQVSEQVDEDLAKIEELLPGPLRLNKKLMSQIQTCLSIKGFDYVQSNIHYTLKHANKNQEAYLIASLENDFAAGARAEERARQNKLKKQQEQDETTKKTKELEELKFREARERYWAYFQSLDDTEKNKIVKDIKSLGFIAGDEKTKIFSYLSGHKRMVL